MAGLTHHHRFGLEAYPVADSAEVRDLLLARRRRHRRIVELASAGCLRLTEVIVRAGSWTLYRTVSQLTNETHGWTYSYLLEHDPASGKPTWAGIDFIRRPEG